MGELTAVVKIQVGDKYVAVAPGLLPPVGTQVQVHKHLYDGGTYPLVEVVKHVWRLEQTGPDELPVFDVTVETRIIDG